MDIRKLDSQDIEYHKFVIKQIGEAQAASRSWAKYITNKYKLQQGDSITDEGEIQSTLPVPNMLIPSPKLKEVKEVKKVS